MTIGFSKRLSLLLYAGAVFAIGILPFLVLSFFSYPNAEDLSLSNFARINGTWDSMVNLYYTYDGRFFCNFITSFNPLVFGWTEGYHWASFFFLISFFASVHFALSVIISGQISQSKVLAISTTVSAVYFAMLPSMAHSVYWMVSAIVYMLPVTFFNALVGSLILFSRTAPNSRKRLSYLLFLMILAGATVGLSAAALPMVNLLVLLWLIHAIVTQKNYRTESFFLLVSTGLFTLIFITAPGISERMTHFEVEYTNQHYFNMIYESFYDLIQSLALWLFRIPLIPISTLLLLGLAYQYKSKQLSFFDFKKHVLLWFPPFALFTIIMILLTFYIPMGPSTGYPKRMFNIVLWFFMLSWSFWLFLAYGQYLHNISIVRRVFGHQLYLPIAGLIFLFSLTYSINVPWGFNVLKDGSAMQYKRDVDERYRLLEAAEADAAVPIKGLSDTTSIKGLIWFAPDIKPNRRESFWNQSYEQYFDVYEVYLETDTIRKSTE